MITYLSISVPMAFITSFFLSKKISDRFDIFDESLKIMQMVTILISLIIWPFLIFWILFDTIFYFEEKYHSKIRDNKNNPSVKIEKIFKCRRCKGKYKYEKLGKIRHSKKNGQSYSYSLCTRCDLDLLFRKGK